MEIEFDNNKIRFNKVLNNLDKFTINFTKILDKLNIKYVIISGYVAILFGRSRNSEDVDIIIDRVDENKFTELWSELYKSGFECILCDTSEFAFKDYISINERLRFAKTNTFIPNMEIKVYSESIDKWVLDNSIEVIFNNNSIFISNIELQIAYKLYLSSEKDIEDARYLYKLFIDNIKLNELDKWVEKLNVKNVFKRYLL